MSKKKHTNNNPKEEESKAAAPKITPSPVLEEPSQSKSFWINHPLHIIIIFILSSVLYANTIFHQYAVDDSIVILRNQFTKKGFAGMKGIWGEDTFTGFFGKQRNLVAGGRYRPLTLATFAVELQLFGKPIVDANGKPILDADGDITYSGSPYISHFINLLMYGWLCVVIYLLLLQLFNPRREQNNLKGYFIALAGALLYAAHPIHTEAVANIKGRDEIMVLLGSLLATYWVLKAAVTEDKNKVFLYHFGAIVAFTAAIFSKENAITFLAIIPAALYFFTQTPINKIAAHTVPYFGIVVFFWFGVRATILGDTGAIIGSDNAPAMELMNDPFLKLENNRYVHYTTEERLATILYTWIEYIKLLIFPHPLTNDYYPKHITMDIATNIDTIPTFKMGKVLLSFLVHLGLAALMAWGTLRRKPFAFFILFYFATFSVVSNLIFPIGTNMAERFMFLPSVGFSALCAMGLYKLIEGNLSKGMNWKKASNTAIIILGVVTAAYSIKTIVRNPAWYDDYVLFTTDITTSPNSAKLNNAVSGVLQERANITVDQNERQRIVEEALTHSIKATTLHPTYNNAWLLRGNANVMLGNMWENKGAQMTDNNARSDAFGKSLKYYNDAIVAYTETKRLRPDHPDVLRNLGVVNRDKGRLMGQRLGNVQESIACLEQSIKHFGKDFETFRLLGVAYGVQGMQLQQAGRGVEAVTSHNTAIGNFEKALEMIPNSVTILYNLEVAYRQLGNVAKADEIQKQWKTIDPNYDPTKQE